MPRWIEVMAAVTNARDMITGGGSMYLIQANNGALYLIYINGAVDVVFRKSTDGGISWSDSTNIFTGTTTQLSVWYDRWSGISGDLIHIAYTESVTDDTLYRTIDTGSADALSTQTVIFAGASTAGGCSLSITRARGGNVYCATMIDAGAEGGFFRLPNANVPNGAWDAARATVYEASTQDQVLLVPGFAADNQDIMCMFWDASADEISRKVYDDSANSWAETSIATSFVDSPAATAFPNYAAAVDLANNRIVLVAWNGVDTANADLRCWTITEGAITDTGDDVVLNGTDDQGLCAVGIDTANGVWYVFYCGKSDGSETWLSSLNIYYKASTDGGATWGPETQVTNRLHERGMIFTIPRFTGTPVVVSHRNIAQDELLIALQNVEPRASVMVGI